MYVVCVCMYVVFCKIDHCIHIHWCIVMTWTQWSLGRVTHVTSTDMGSKVIWGSMTFGSSFWKKESSVSTYFDVFSNLILQWLQKYVIAKAGETRGSRTALLGVRSFVPILVARIDPKMDEFGNLKANSHYIYWTHTCSFMNRSG